MAEVFSQLDGVATVRGLQGDGLNLAWLGGIGNKAVNLTLQLESRFRQQQGGNGLRDGFAPLRIGAGLNRGGLDRGGLRHDQWR